MQTSSKDTFNEDDYVYFKIVKSDGEFDFLGAVAYCLYKQDKVRHIRNWQKHHEGQTPTQEELKDWQKVEYPKEKCIELKEKVARIYVNNFIKDCFSRAQNLCPNKNSFRYGVWQSVVGSFFFTLFLVIFYIFFKIPTVDKWVDKGLEKLGISITSSTNSLSQISPK